MHMYTVNKYYEIKLTLTKCRTKLVILMNLVLGLNIELAYRSS